MKKPRRPLHCRYLIMDARAFTDLDKAIVLDMADSQKQGICKSKQFGNYKNFEVAIVDSKSQEVCWNLYA